jgi:hypothetical protein
MRYAKDTFLHFLADNLTGITIHPVRNDPSDPKSGVPALNAISVTFMNVDPDTQLAAQHVAVDIIADTEAQADLILNACWLVLGASFSTPLLDYSNPAAPVPKGSNKLYWERDRVKFRRVLSDFYCHYTASIKLKFHADR